MKLNRLLTTSAISIGLASSLYAYEMKPVGFKAMGMGGTGVASSRGSFANYYNPALLRMSDYTTEVSLNVSARLRESNVADNMDTLSDIDFQKTLDNIADNAVTRYNGGANDGKANNAEDIKNLQTAVKTLQSISAKNALSAGANASLSAQISDSLSLGVYAHADVAMQMEIDGKRLDLIFKKDGQYLKYDPNTDRYDTSSKEEYESSSLEYAVDNGLSFINLDALVLTEVPISYAKAYDFKNGYWSFGASIKPMALTMFKKKVELGESSDDANNDSDSSAHEITYENTIGLDIGVAYRPSNTDLTIGLVGKNINSPEFEVDKVGSQVQGAKDYKIDPYFRAGVSYPILDNNIEFAFDVDLQKSDTLIEGEKTQMIGAGVELHPSSWFAARLGVMNDIGAETFDEGVILTGGVGFGLKWFQLDISAMASTEKGTYDGNEIPKYVALNLSLLSRWGEGYNKKRPNIIEPVEDKKDFTENVAPTKILTDEKMKEMEEELDKETK